MTKPVTHCFHTVDCDHFRYLQAIIPLRIIVNERQTIDLHLSQTRTILKHNVIIHLRQSCLRKGITPNHHTLQLVQSIHNQFLSENEAAFPDLNSLQTLVRTQIHAFQFPIVATTIVHDQFRDDSAERFPLLEVTHIGVGVDSGCVGVIREGASVWLSVHPQTTHLTLSMCRR